MIDGTRRFRDGGGGGVPFSPDLNRVAAVRERLDVLRCLQTRRHPPLPPLRSPAAMSEPTQLQELPRPTRAFLAWWFRLSLGSALAALVGAMLAVWPHWVCSQQPLSDWTEAEAEASAPVSRGSGDPRWIADQDELYYLAVGGRSLRGVPGDPALPPDRLGRVPYKSTALDPGVTLARWFGLTADHLGIVWRLQGGATAGIGWFLVFHTILGPRRFRSTSALALTVILLADVGVLDYRPLIENWLSLLPTGESPPNPNPPRPMTNFRLATPGLTQGFLALFIAFAIRTRSHMAADETLHPPFWATVSAGLFMGLLFHVYFYYWTAVFSTLLVMAVCDWRGRTAYLGILLLGLTVGAGSILKDAIYYNQFPDDWLARTDKFLVVNRTEDLHLSKGASAMVLLGWVGLITARRRGWSETWLAGLTLTWALGTTGWLLVKQQLLTGIEIENFHWKYVAGPGLMVFWLGGLTLALGRERPAAIAALLGLLAVLQFALALNVRRAEALGPNESVELRAWLRAMDALDDRTLPTASPLAGPEKPVSIACLKRGAVPVANYWTRLSPAFDDLTWHRRIALNAAVQGQSRDEFVRAQVAEFNRIDGFGGPWRRDPAARARAIRIRLEAFDDITANPTDWITPDQVTHVLMPIDRTPLTPDTPDFPGWVRLLRLQPEGYTPLDLWALRPAAATLAAQAPPSSPTVSDRPSATLADQTQEVTRPLRE